MSGLQDLQDLQTALDRPHLDWEPTEWVKVDHADWVLITEAARKYANPDYETTAIIQHNRNLYEPMWVVWADLTEGDRMSRIKQAKVDVVAALGVTENTDA